MVTFLDITLLQGFQSIFIFLLVWALVYGVLSYTNPLGQKDEKKGLYAFIGLFMGLLTLFSGPVITVISVIAPWFVTLTIFLVFMLMLFYTLGYKESDVHEVLKSKEWSGQIAVWVIVISVIILLGGLGYVFFTGQLNPQTTATDPAISRDATEVGDIGTDAFFATIFHPRVLGMITVLVIGFLAIIFMAKPNR